MISINFSTDMRRICFWGERMGVSLRNPTQFTGPYSWCQTRLEELSDQMVDYHGFRPKEPSDDRMLFALVCDPHAWRIDKVPSIALPRETIELPRHATSFFSSSRRKQWERIFHSPLWYSIGHINVPGSNAVSDLLNLLQCLLPGMLVVVDVQDGWSTTRGIPPIKWIFENKPVLECALGCDRYEALCRAARDPRKAFIDSREVPAVSSNEE